MADSESVTPQDGAEDTTATPDTEQPDADRTERAGQALDRDGLEKALRKARDEAAKQRQKAKFSFEDEETFNRAKEALAELQKVEDSKRSEVEKLTEEREQLMWRSSQAESNLLRLRVALGAGIPADRADEFASRLRGDSEDELRADAEQLRVLFTPQQVAPERRADPSQGKGRASEPPTNSLQAALESKLGISR